MAAIPLKQYIDALIAPIIIAFNNSTIQGISTSQQQQILMTSKVLTSSLIINSNENALGIGPLAVAPGNTLTLEPGSSMRII